MSLGFENLEVCQRSGKLAIDIVRYSKNGHYFLFNNQITRSFFPFHPILLKAVKENHYYTIAKGSTSGLRTQIMIGIKIDYINKDTGEKWIKETRELSAMYSILIKSIFATKWSRQLPPSSSLLNISCNLWTV